VITTLWVTAAALVITAAVLLSIARVVLPYADRYRPEIVDWISASIGMPVSIADLEVRWRRFGPYIAISDVALFEQPDGPPVAHLDQAEVGINLFRSVVRGKIAIDTVAVSGIRISVIRKADNSLAVAGIGMSRTAGAAPVASAALVQWLLTQSRLALEQAEVVWYDETREREPLTFRYVNVELRNDGVRHQVSGSAQLPVALGRRISFALDLHGDLLSAGGWSGQAYVSGGGLQVSRWLRELKYGGLALTSGTAELTAWTRWQNGRLQRVEGFTSFFDARVDIASGAAPESAPEAAPGSAPGSAKGSSQSQSLPDARPVREENRSPFSLSAVSGRFAWTRVAEGWRLAVNDFVVDSGGRSWPYSDFTLASAGGPDSVLRGRIGYLDIGDLRRLMLASDLITPELHEILSALQPSGALHDVQLVVPDGTGAGRGRYVSARFIDVHTEPWKRIPGITGFDGRVVLGDRAGSLYFDTTGAALRSNQVFRNDIAVDRLRGRLDWHKAADGWRVRSNDIEAVNQDLNVRAVMDADVPMDGTSPTLGVYATFRAVNGEHKDRYLPAGIMRDTAVHWLDRAIVSGSVPRGTLLIHGPLDKFPFDGGSGRFAVEFDVEDGILDYAPGWPRIEEIAANVEFNGRSMNLVAARAMTLSAELLNVTAHIPNLAAKPAQLDVIGNARGASADVLRFLRESPLHDRFAAYVDHGAAEGDSALQLSLKIPLAHQPVKVAGTLSMTNSRLSFGDGGVAIDAVNGDFSFTDEGLHAKGMQGRILGMDATFGVETLVRKGKRLTEVTATGDARDDQVAPFLTPVMRRLKGSAGWDARLELPEAVAGKIVPGTLRISSDLRGMAIDLPPPIGKAAAEPLPFQLRMTVPREPGSPIRARLGDRLQVVLDLDADMKLARGTVGLGKDPVKLEERPGIHIGGKASYLSYSEWSAVLAPKSRVGRGEANVTSIDLRADVAEALGQKFHHASVKGSRASQAWQLEVDSDEVAGRVEIPVAEEQPVRMDLVHLRLPGLPQEDGKHGLDPRDIPPLVLNSKEFSYGGVSYGSLHLNASRHNDGLRLEKLALKSDWMDLDARGDWLSVNDEQYSSFNIVARSKNIGAALARLGYGGTLNEGEGSFDIVARWSGPPTAFALERLDGDLAMHIKNGRLLEVDPGAGRIFGLMSLQALPRRLSLDFSDIFKKGFTFDAIEGNFKIKEGRARTEDLHMDGPSARIEARGLVDLVHGQYDQNITVLPHLSSSLPLAGAVAGGIGVGAAILIVERMFRPNIEKSTRIEFHVTGPWDNPVVERVATVDSAAPTKKR